MKYILDELKNPIGIKDQKTEFYNYVPGLNGMNGFYVLVTIEGEYYNVFYLDERFKIEPMNNLREQIPLENKPDDWYYYLRLRTIEYHLWYKYDRSFEIREIKE